MSVVSTKVPIEHTACRKSRIFDTIPIFNPQRAKQPTDVKYFITFEPPVTSMQKNNDR